tara:strand:+ start:15553 stop:16773 length:1221 start_codon:yes stop_codon:yes gene_type:complete
MRISSKILYYSHNFKKTGGTLISFNYIKKLIGDGFDVDILLNHNEVAEEFFDKKINYLKICKFTSKIMKLEYDEIKIIKESGNSTKKLKSLLYKFKTYLIKQKILIKIYSIFKNIFFNLMFKINFKLIKKYIKNKNYKAIISTNIFAKLEFNNLLNSATDNFFIHIHNDPYEIRERSNFFYFGNLEEYFIDKKVITISEEMYKKFNASFSPKENSLIYNPMDFNEIRTKSMEHHNILLPKKYFTYVGSLTERKACHRIINAFAENYLNLVVLGDGPEMKNLKQLTKAHNFKGNVIFLGKVENPYRIIKKSLGLILASKSEGFPTVLIESIFLDTGVISTDCETGPNEIIKDKSLLITSNDDLRISEDISNLIFKYSEQGFPLDKEILNKTNPEKNYSKFLKICCLA